MLFGRNKKQKDYSKIVKPLSPAERAATEIVAACEKFLSAKLLENIDPYERKNFSLKVVNNHYNALRFKKRSQDFLNHADDLSPSAYREYDFMRHSLLQLKKLNGSLYWSVLDSLHVATCAILKSNYVDLRDDKTIAKLKHWLIGGSTEPCMYERGSKTRRL